MAVRAKFVVSGIEPYTSPEGVGSVRLRPVYKFDPETGKNDPENAVFGEYTPSGEIQMSIMNPAAFVQFEPNKVFYVDFTPAE